MCVYVCRGCRVYLCVGLPSTSRPFPHLLGTPTGEPLHFPSSSSSISFLVVAVVASIVRTRLGQKKKEIETSCWRTCLDVHATLILKGNNPKNKIKRRRVFLTAIIHSLCVCARITMIESKILFYPFVYIFVSLSSVSFFLFKRIPKILDAHTHTRVCVCRETHSETL